jgi:hypothetical protein
MALACAWSAQAKAQSACSTGSWAPIPRDDGQVFQVIVGSSSAGWWALIPRDGGQVWPTV